MNVLKSAFPNGDENKKSECSYSVSNAIRTLLMVAEAGFEPTTFGL